MPHQPGLTLRLSAMEPAHRHSSTVRRQRRGEVAGAWLWAGLLLCVTGLGGEPTKYIEPPRALDEVYFRSGDVVRGTLSETDGGKLKIRDFKKNFTREFNKDEAKEIKRRQTPEVCVERALNESAGDSHRTLKVAQEAMQDYTGMTAKVITALESESRSKDPALLAYLTDLYIQAGQGKPALRVAEVLVGVAGSRASSYMWRGSAHLLLENKEAAEKDLNKAFSMDKSDLQILVARANFLLNNGRAAEAEQAFSDALAQDKQNVSAHCGLGLVQLRQGHFVAAIKSFEEALLLNDGARLARIGLANAKLMNKDYKAAEAEAERILVKDPKCAEAYAVEAMAKLLGGEKDALSGFERLSKMSLDEKKNQPRLLLARAATLERQALMEEALNTPESQASAKSIRDQVTRAIQDLIDADPADAYLQYLFGERKFRAGEHSSALPHFQRAAQLAPMFAPAHAAVAATALRLNKWDMAKTSYEAAVKLDPAGADYHAGLGLAILKQQRFEDARSAFLRATDGQKPNVTALCGLGYVANAAREKEAAIGFFQQALAVDGSCAYAADALKKIYAQDDQVLEYITFEDGAPAGWRPRSSTSIKSSVANGQLLFSGTQGATAGTKAEFYRDLKAEEFVELQADLEIAPNLPVAFGLRVGSGSTATGFEVELGKDESNEVKVRFRDARNLPLAWQSAGLPWPATGRIRLGIFSSGLRTGHIGVVVNGKRSLPITLTLPRISKLSVGFFVQPQAREIVHATVDNVALVYRTGATAEKEPEDTQVIFEEKKSDGGKDDKNVDKPEENKK